MVHHVPPGRSWWPRARGRTLRHADGTGASAPEAAGPQGSYAPGLSAGPDGVSHGQQDEAAGDAWKSPLQWNDVIGGGAQGTGPRQDA